MKKNENDLFDIPQDSFSEVSDAARLLRNFVSKVDQKSKESSQKELLFSPDASGEGETNQDNSEIIGDMEIAKVDQFLERAHFLSENLDRNVAMAEQSIQNIIPKPSSHVLEPLLNPPPEDLHKKGSLFYETPEDNEEKNSSPAPHKTPQPSLTTNSVKTLTFNDLDSELFSLQDSQTSEPTLPNVEPLHLLEATKTKDTIQEVPFDPTMLTGEDEDENTSLATFAKSEEEKHSSSSNDPQLDYAFLDSITDLPSFDTLEHLVNDFENPLELTLGNSDIDELLPKSAPINLPDEKEEITSPTFDPNRTQDLPHQLPNTDETTQTLENSVVLSDAPGFVDALDNDLADLLDETASTTSMPTFTTPGTVTAETEITPPTENSHQKSASKTTQPSMPTLKGNEEALLPPEDLLQMTGETLPNQSPTEKTSIPSEETSLPPEDLLQMTGETLPDQSPTEKTSIPSEETPLPQEEPLDSLEEELLKNFITDTLATSIMPTLESLESWEEEKEPSPVQPETMRIVTEEKSSENTEHVELVQQQLSSSEELPPSTTSEKESPKLDKAEASTPSSEEKPSSEKTTDPFFKAVAEEEPPPSTSFLSEADSSKTITDEFAAVVSSVSADDLLSSSSSDTLPIPTSNTPMQSEQLPIQTKTKEPSVPVLRTSDTADELAETIPMPVVEKEEQSPSSSIPPEEKDESFTEEEPPAVLLTPEQQTISQNMSEEKENAKEQITPETTKPEEAPLDDLPPHASDEEEWRNFDEEDDGFDEMSNQFFSSPAIDSYETSRRRKKFNDLLAKQNKHAQTNSSSHWIYVIIIAIMGLTLAFFATSYFSRSSHPTHHPQPNKPKVTSRKTTPQPSRRQSAQAKKRVVLALHKVEKPSTPAKTSVPPKTPSPQEPKQKTKATKTTPSPTPSPIPPKNRPEEKQRPRKIRRKRRTTRKIRRKRRTTRKIKRKRRTTRKIKRKRRNPALAKKYFQKGLQMFMKGKLTSARRYFSRSVRANPNKNAYRLLTLTYIRLKKRWRAKRAFRQFKRLDPKSPLLPMLKKQIDALR